MWKKLGMSILIAVSFIYILYLCIIPIFMSTEDLQFVAVVTLTAAVGIPLSGMLETEFMKVDDANEPLTRSISLSTLMTMNRSNK